MRPRSGITDLARTGRPLAAVAFTLVELLVVVAVVGILASLLLTALSGARFRSRVNQCVSNYRQWGIAVHAYAGDDAKGRLPAFTFPLSAAANYTELSPWFVAYEMGPKLVEYGVAPPLWFCPARPEAYHRAIEFLRRTRPNDSALGVSNLVRVWRTQSVGFAIIEHSWWVPRPVEGSPYTFPDPRVLKCRNPDGWPTKLDDPVGAHQPILTDAAFATWNETRTGFKGVGLGHRWPVQFTRSLNLLYVDGHVETKPRHALQWQVEGGTWAVLVY